MNRTLKKLAVCILSIIMVLCSCIPAYAKKEDFSIGSTPFDSTVVESSPIAIFDSHVYPEDTVTIE